MEGSAFESQQGHSLRASNVGFPSQQIDAQRSGASLFFHYERFVKTGTNRLFQGKLKSLARTWK
nr:MAG: hypothetical protein DIU68_01115 [Chloroflexota bacterium]